MPVIRASVVQTCTAAYSLPDTLNKLHRLAKLAKERDGSQLAVFPEAFIGGYPRHSTFGAVIGSRSPEGRDEFLRYHQAAIEIPSPAITRIEAIARETELFLIVGVIERDGGTLFCTAVFIDPKSGYVAKHRKLMPTASERLVWGLGDSSTLSVVEGTFLAGDVTTKAKLSSCICWENYMPLLRTHYYSKGVQIWCAPTVDSRPVWQSTMTHIALEGRCFVLSACQFAQQKDFPPDHSVPLNCPRDPESVMIGGGSVIIDPLGQVLAGPLREGEGVLTADLDLDEIIRGKFDLDCVGHYARPDIFQLSVTGN
ncbi:carbon-nitrogen hydrolase [Sistotremastrum suecicum HHB10207 ss-3]|uniref:Carbon-nitrogen hydrolase n=1 Tax=Sistotremastrum suecicum HHB10207 ss-3 TaxID=1314776 RepID=A0A166J8Q6_9AGAM|nr:carbon-nitrogen hydrolase [Sistotremastrum suecicum HHB10207 ss-3]